MRDLIALLARQRTWSALTFGPGYKTEAVLEHIRSELHEIEEHPLDLEEWIDVVLLAFDGAWRAGYRPEAIVQALITKQAKNEARLWPDWRTVPAGKPVRHLREPL